MRRNGVRRVPVVAGQAHHLVGLLSREDLLGVAAQTLNKLHQLGIRANLLEAVDRD